MKKSVLMAAALAFATGASAQMPDGSVAPDFTATDIDGNTWHLYDLLDQGYTVVMDISAAWCGPCWNYHNTGNLENLYDTYGPGTSYDKVMVLFIEGEGTNTLAQIQGTSTGSTYATFTQGDWTAGTPYPIIDNATIANDYEITYFPTIYTICPNRILQESGQISTAQHWTIAQNCPEAVSGINAAVLSYDGETIVCGALDMPVTIQNMGTSSLTSCNIAIKQSGTTIAGPYAWSGSLATYNTASHTFSGVNVTNPGAVTVEITSSDADASDNSLDPGLVPAVDATQNLYFNLLLDYYCSETTWKLKNSGGTTVQQGGPYNCAAAGGGADANTLKQYNWTVPMDCYQMWLYDAYGDGLLSTAYGPHADGSWELKDGGYNLLWSGAANFGADEKGGVNVNALAGIEDNTLGGDLTIYPNPANSMVTLTIPLMTGGNVTVLVYDVLGEVVMGFDHQMGMGNNVVPMDLSGLENGVYLFNITANGKTETRRVTVNK